MDIKYLCQNCEKLEGECFLCGKNATYNIQPIESKIKKNDEKIKDPE